MSDDDAKRRSFTSQKLDWLKAVAADHDLTDRSFRVAFVIALHINQRTGTCSIADETVRDMTGIPVRWVVKARHALRAAGWLDWKRTSTSNVYRTLDEPMHDVQFFQSLLKQNRDAKREVRKMRRRVLTPASDRKAGPVLTQASDHKAGCSDACVRSCSDASVIQTLKENTTEEVKDDAEEEDTGINGQKGWRQ